MLSSRRVLLPEERQICLLLAPFLLLQFFFVRRVVLLAESLVLRQQLGVLLRERPRRRLRLRDRFFWLWCSRRFSDWRSWLAIVQPETVIAWLRRGFRLYSRWNSGGGAPVRPTIPRNVIALIQRMAKEDMTWAMPRIRAELHLLGHDVAESTVAKYLPKRRKTPSQTWKTFLWNHVGCLASIDFFVVPTATFHLLYDFVILVYKRHCVVQFNVTSHPTSQCVVRRLKEAYSFDTAPRYLIRDRDRLYGAEVRQALHALGFEEVVLAPRPPWQNTYCQRLISTLRHKCLDT